MANYMCIIFSLMILHCTRVRCANSDSNALQDIREANIASVFIKMAEKTKEPLIQILGKSFQRIEKKVDAFDMFIEKICSIALCADWSEWTVCVFKKRNRTRSCRKASSFCLETNSESCETCEHGIIQNPQSDDECTDLRPKIVLSPSKIRATEDKPVSFQCQVSGEGPFNIVWSRLDSRQLPDRATVSPRYSLTIRNLERDDTGRYICTATNRYGVTRREVELIVIAVEDYCDPRGSKSLHPYPSTNRCDCRDNAAGELCDTCKANTFYLSSTYELGCVRCFCMGVSNLCQSTTWNRTQDGLSFSRYDFGVTITDMNGKPLLDRRLTTDTSNQEVIYRTRDLNKDTLYWSLPDNFLGDKVTAYGGALRFTLRFGSRHGQEVAVAEPLIKISGNGITLAHRSPSDFLPTRPTAVIVMMYEQNWYRKDGQTATREHLLMVLADLDSILIKATFERPQAETGLRAVTLDVAESRRTRQDRAYAVESCQCPVGYRGLSCEDCDTGYTRTGGGLYLGLCEPCCSGHSNECDPETVVCRNCQHNTAGDYCELCAVGFYGNAKQGRRDDCQRCPCPLTESPNQFSPSCILDTDGQVTCTACPAGHTGRRCETCVQGYSGNPLKIGDYCRIITGPTCDCDSRGIVPNTQCDEATQQCQCKPYIQGLRCARCREGHFHLEASNPQGCLTCFCSGITKQCTSSNYYREALRPVLGADGSHNFVLMNRRMDNIISDGFVVDANRNQVTFNQFEGVQQERESLFFQLPAKFRGDRVTSYGGYLRFTLEFSARPQGRTYRGVDLEIISTGQSLRLYNLFEPGLQEGHTQTYEILLRESSFNDLRSNTAPTRETFMTILSDIAGILIRATYHENMASVTLRDVSMDTAVATPTSLGGAPMVEDCRCPKGYTGLSCQRCADGYLRVSDGRGGVGRCVKAKRLN